MGPATYDLASLLRDSYVDLPEEFVEELERGVPAAGGARTSRARCSAGASS